MKNKRIMFIGCILLYALCRVFLANNASAADWGSIKAKAVFEGVYGCAKNHAFATNWNASDNDNLKGFLSNSDLGKDAVKLPYGQTEVKDNDLSCSEVMLGLGGTGLKKGLIGNINQYDALSTAKLFAGENLDGNGGLGYTAVGTGSSGNSEEMQISLKVSLNSAVGSGKSIYALSCEGNREKSDWNNCFGSNNTSKTIQGEKLDDNTLIFPVSRDGKFVSDRGSNVISLSASTDNAFAYGICDSNGCINDYFTVSRGFNGEYLIQSYVADSPNPNGIIYVFADGKDSEGEADIFVFTKSIARDTSESDVYDDYALSWSGDNMALVTGLNSKNNAGYSAKGISDYSSLALTDQEVYDLYSYYLTDVYGAQVFCDDDSGYENYSSSPKINFRKGQECRVLKSDVKSPSNPVYGVSKTNHFNQKISSVDTVIKKLNSLNLDNIDTDGSQTVKDQNKEEEEEQKCRNEKGAGSLGWIVCPVLDWMGEAAQQVYEDYVAPSLQIKPVLFEGNDSNGGVRVAWSSFRDMANVVFIILLLVVIFAQLTGIGIDNYGIKKILPRLIVAVILINLSYIVCILAVDISNILGNGLQSIFDSLGSNLNPTLDLASDGAESITIQSGNNVSATGVLASVGVLAGIVGMVGAIWANPAILLSLLVGALGVVVSVFFLFLLLAARKAAIIVLTAISPLAVVAYMLPNTKSLFDKWLKFFEGLLLVYPIAGLLVGAGDYVSRLLLSTSDGFFTALTAMVVGVVPIFFIPMVLKSSFAAMGKVGGVLTGLGRNAGSRATKAVRGSNMYKNAEEAGRMRQTRIRAGVDRNGNAVSMGRFRRMIRGGNRNIAANRAQYRRDQSDVRARDELMNNDVYDARLQSDRESQALKNYSEQYSVLTRGGMATELKAAADAYSNDASAENATRLQAAISAAEGRGMNKEMLSSLEGLSLSSGNSNDAKILGQLAGSKNKLISQYGKQVSKVEGAPVSMRQFVNGSGGDSSPKMSEAFRNQGSGVLAGMDDDTLRYIKDNGRDSISTDMLVNAATNTSNEKELREINEMLASRSDLEGKISGEQLAGFNTTTLETMAASPGGGAAIASAITDLASNEQLSSRVTGEKRDKMIGALSNDGLRDLATNTKLDADNSFRTAAAAEYQRRTEQAIGLGNGGSVDGGASTSGTGASGSSSGAASGTGGSGASTVPAPQPQIQPAQSGQRLDTTTSFSEARANPQPRSILRNAPQTSRGIILPGDTASISGMADEVRRNPSVPPQNPQIQPAQSEQRLDTTASFSEARANPQPRSTLRNAPQTSRGIVLPGDTTSISGMADEVRRNPSVSPQNPPQP